MSALQVASLTLLAVGAGGLLWGAFRPGASAGLWVRLVVMAAVIALVAQAAIAVL